VSDRLAGRHTSGRLATALAYVGLFNALSIILMYAGVPIFGPLNDLGVASAAVLQAILALRLGVDIGARFPAVGLVAATVGALVAAIGSGLVLSGASDWFVAGVVSTLGYAVLGVWVIAANRHARLTGAWPAPLATFGIRIGAVMCLGFLALLAIKSSVGGPTSAPWFVWAAYSNGVGWFILLPMWNFRLGRYLRSRPVAPG
jgi:hypothetical protein